MAMRLWKRLSNTAGVISKSLMYSNMASSKVICTTGKFCWTQKSDFIRKFSQLDVWQSYECCSSLFPHLPSFLVPSKLPSSRSDIVFQHDNCSNQKFDEAQQHGRLLLISILAILGAKTLNSIPVLLADEINSEQNNSTEHYWNDGEHDQGDACNETDEKLYQDSLENDGTFSQVFPEDLPITDPIEISDVHSLKHSHVVREAAGVSAESALVLVIRASRALLAAIDDYRASLLHLLDLLSYNAELIHKAGQGAIYEEFLQQVTEAMVAAKAHTDNAKKRVIDLKLVVRVSAQAVESLNLCCLLSGAEATALASSAAVTSLRSQVEAAEREVRHLQADALARQAELIVMEGDERQLEDGGRQLEDGGRQLEDGGRQLEDGGRQLEDCDRQLEDGGRQVEEHEQGDEGKQKKEALARKKRVEESMAESEV